jgi:hypothetical protein
MHQKTGETASLACVGIGVPDVEISWSFNGTPVINTSFHEENIVIGGIIFKQSLLQICGLNESDAGYYTCVISDGYTTANATTKLSVKGLLAHTLTNHQRGGGRNKASSAQTSQLSPKTKR